jgi:hypothetical protein
MVVSLYPSRVRSSDLLGRDVTSDSLAMASVDFNVGGASIADA